MKISARSSAQFQKKLEAWYSSHHRKLPWRETNDPYRIWISEIMLQQTTVQTVIPYFSEWTAHFPDMETLSEAPLQKILKVWQGLGYYNRAKNLHRAAKIIMRNFDGQIPDKYDDLINLPGFGPYTTAAVLSIAYDKPFLTIDANIRRILMRLLNLPRRASSRIDKMLQQHFSPLLPRKNPGIFNQALMELGSLVCRSKNPICLQCPVPDFCEAFKAGKQEVIPVPEKRSYKKINAVIGIIEKEKKYLIQKRPPTGLLADLWEFPGGKIEKGETAKQALKREILEEIGAEIHEAQYLTKVQHSYTQFQVTLQAWSCTLKTEPLLDESRHRWVTLKGLRQFPVPSGSAKVIRFLEIQNNLRRKK
jgi:A/G-specific adenine glycosylase